MTKTNIVRGALVALVGLVLAGCGGGAAPVAPPTTLGGTGTSASSSAPSTTTAPATATPVIQRAVLTSPHSAVKLYGSPGGTVIKQLPALTVYGSARTFLVDQVAGSWVRVLLPTRPNGSTAWVSASSVTLESIQTRITVDVANHTITVAIPGHAPVTAPAAVGSLQNPTPHGRFYVTDRVAPSDPKGAYGALALGLSAHSDTLSEFGGGDGQVAIHGTNEPASIGKPVSHGCVRVGPAVVALLQQIPLGTPVVIT